MAEQGNNKPQTLLKVYMASQQKQEKIFIFNNRQKKHGKNQGLYIAKTRKNFIFHGGTGNNNPQ